MATGNVPIVLSGVLYPKGKKGEHRSARTADDRPIPCTFVGQAMIGAELPEPPIEPPVEPGPGPGEPPHPAFPIWGPPGINFPGTPGYPPVAGHPLPIPPEPVDPENPEPVVGWEPKAAWTPTTGWIVVLVPDDDTLVPTPSSTGQ
jgi:hypothetical protein